RKLNGFPETGSSGRTGCCILCSTAWNERAGLSRGGARLRPGANANTTHSRRMERERCRNSATSGVPFRGCSDTCGRSNMFNLNLAIAEWRRKMAAAGIGAPEALDELEGHLRDAVEGQMRSGANARQAFEMAVRHLGQPAALGYEFRKVGPLSAVREGLLI